MKIQSVGRLRATDDDGRDIAMEAGDVLTVGDTFGKLACEMGWATDVDGNVATGERRTGAVEVTAQNVISESG